MSNGVAFSQSGIPLRLAAEYQKPIDSRVKYLEIELDDSFKFSVPAVAKLPSYTTRVFAMKRIADHSLGYFPLFEASATLINGTVPTTDQQLQVCCDETGVYVVTSFQDDLGQNQTDYLIKVRIYTVNLEEAYDSGTTNFAPGKGIAINDYGIKFVDDSGRSNISDKSSVGFSVDTTKKIIPIHKVILKYFDGTPATDTVEHGAGYPPTYLLGTAPTYLFTNYNAGYTTITWRDKKLCEPMSTRAARINANTRTMRFRGVQSVFQGNYVIVILKDPMDLSA